jgi:hypothetical protein
MCIPPNLDTTLLCIATIGALTDQLGSILYAPLMFPLRIRRFRKISWVNLYAIELMALTGAILRLATQVCD